MRLRLAHLSHHVLQIRGTAALGFLVPFSLINCMLEDFKIAEHSRLSFEDFHVAEDWTGDARSDGRVGCLVKTMLLSSITRLTSVD